MTQTILAIPPLGRNRNHVRFLNKHINQNERTLIANYWNELIQLYGTEVAYYTINYQLSSHNALYGEEPTAIFDRTHPIVMIIDITNDSLLLSKFGLAADCDMTAIISIDTFKKIFGPQAEPKSGDLIRLIEFGSDRPANRAAPLYEITERDDELITQTNALLGHYVWYLKCKHFNFSYEPGVENSPTNIQINDDGLYGRLPCNTTPEIPTDLVQPYEKITSAAECIATGQIFLSANFCDTFTLTSLSSYPISYPLGIYILAADSTSPTFGQNYYPYLSSLPWPLSAFQPFGLSWRYSQFREEIRTTLQPLNSNNPHYFYVFVPKNWQTQLVYASINSLALPVMPPYLDITQNFFVYQLSGLASSPQAFKIILQFTPLSGQKIAVQLRDCPLPNIFSSPSLP